MLNNSIGNIFDTRYQLNTGGKTGGSQIRCKRTSRANVPTPLIWPQTRFWTSVWLRERNSIYFYLKKSKTGPSPNFGLHIIGAPMQRSCNANLYIQRGTNPEVPKQWKLAKMIMLSKPGKIPEKSSSYQFASLFTMTFKLYILHPLKISRMKNRFLITNLDAEPSTLM